MEVRSKKIMLSGIDICSKKKYNSKEITAAAALVNQKSRKEEKMKNAIKFMAGLLFAITVALGYQVQPASAQYVCDFTDNPKCQVSLHSGERLDMIWQPHKTLIGSMINDSNSSAEVVWQIASPPQPVTLFEGDYYPIEAETLFSTNGFIENDSTDDTVVLVYLQKSSR